jgi:hypothetical protein
VNGRILVTSLNSVRISVLLQLNTNTGTDALGGATMIIGFDTSGISFKVNPVKNVDYIFHNFCGGNYSSATVTRPMNNRIWVNIDLPFTNSNHGTIVSGGVNWTDVVTINFDIIDPQGLASVYWLTNSVFWGIYDDDNNTSWNTGLFQNLIDIPLPVELFSFTAKIINENVELDWITKTEVNNYGFYIERKIDGNNWQKIGFVDGYGNSNSPNYYSFVDKHPTGGSSFSYRLKQIDTDGTYEFSEIVEVEYIPHKFTLYQNYPNPFNPSTKIKFQIAAKDLVTLKIFDILSNEVEVLVNKEMETGTYEIEFTPASGNRELVSGVYFYKLTAGNFVETKKMILLK